MRLKSFPFGLDPPPDDTGVTSDPTDAVVATGATTMRLRSLPLGGTIVSFVWNFHGGASRSQLLTSSHGLGHDRYEH